MLSRADQSLARLDGVTSTLPNPELFVAMYVRQEAVLSSQIERTQSTLEDVLQFEIDPQGEELPRDVEEVVNYVSAMNYGLSRLPDLPLSLRLIREIHGILVQDTRGGEKTPGEFRRSQNWIGPQGCSLNNATFVPPPVHYMNESLSNLEKFLHDQELCRYFHKAAGINGAAQAVHDLGKKAEPRILTKAASAYENSAVRRLGYLLERFGHNRQAESLKSFAKKAKSFKALDPAVKPLVAELALLDEKNHDWKLIINVPVEIDT